MRLRKNCAHFPFFWSTKIFSGYSIIIKYAKRALFHNLSHWKCMISHIILKRVTAHIIITWKPIISPSRYLYCWKGMISKNFWLKKNWKKIVIYFFYLNFKIYFWNCAKTAHIIQKVCLRKCVTCHQVSLCTVWAQSDNGFLTYEQKRDLLQLRILRLFAHILQNWVCQVVQLDLEFIWCQKFENRRWSVR